MQKEPNEDIPEKTAKTILEESELGQEVTAGGEKVKKILVERDSGTPEETVMDREIRNVLDGEPDKRLFLTESKASIFVEENAMDAKDAKEAKDTKDIKNAKEAKDVKDKENAKDATDAKDEDNTKILFEQLEELLDNASWQHLLQHCLQNF